MDFKDYYATLGVAKTATEKEIKQAYRKLARKHHPDVNPGDKAAEARFKEINEANEVLGDPEKRKKYDELGANWRAVRAGRARRRRQPVRRLDVELRRRAGGGGYRTMTQEEMEEMFGGDAIPFSDFFHDVLRRRRRPAGGERPRPRRPRRAPRAGPRRRARDRARRSRTRTTARRGASRCSTTARRARWTCASPPASATARACASPAKASRAPAARQAGDLYLRVRLAPHPMFERKGRDLYTRVPVPVTTAVLGGEVDVPTLAGKTLRLKIPPSTQNGQVFRLRATACRRVGKPDEHGDLYATRRRAAAHRR